MVSVCAYGTYIGTSSIFEKLPVSCDFFFSFIHPFQFCMCLCIYDALVCVFWSCFTSSLFFLFYNYYCYCYHYWLFFNPKSTYYWMFFFFLSFSILHTCSLFALTNFLFLQKMLLPSTLLFIIFVFCFYFICLLMCYLLFYFHLSYLNKQEGDQLIRRKKKNVLYIVLR